MKKFFLILTALVSGFLPVVRGADYTELSERSNGRILCVRIANEYRFFVFIRPMPIDSWLCREYLSGKTVELYPKKLELMPFFEQDDDFAIETWVIWHLLHPRSAEHASCAAFAPLINLSRVARCRKFLETVRRQRADVERLYREYQRTAGSSVSRSKVSSGDFFNSGNGNSLSFGVSADTGTGDGNVTKRMAADAIADLILHGEVLPELESTLQSQDYFLAIACFSYYRNCVKNWLSLNNGTMAQDFEEVVRRFDTIGQTMVTNYRLDREKNRLLEDDFSRVCPALRGAWKQARPVTFQELSRLHAVAFDSWKKSRELSPACDFPEWGSATLDVLAMMPGCRDAEGVAAAFKDALKKYQDAFADEVN